MYYVHTTYHICSSDMYYILCTQPHRKRAARSFVALMALENNARYTAKMVIMMQINPSRQEG